MRPLHRIESSTVVLDVDHIDTDQIIPARFLTVTDKHNLGSCAFADWRQDPTFVLNRPGATRAEILVAGDNFGCGSSREHAPWALVAFGFRVVISTGIADIFKGNATRCGLLPIEVNRSIYNELVADDGQNVVVDLETQTVTSARGSDFHFDVEAFARHCLLRGLDQLDVLMQMQPQINAYEEQVI